MSGTPPRRAISSNSAPLAFTSAMIVAPGCSRNTSAAHTASATDRPRVSRPRHRRRPCRSPSPSNAIPTSSAPPWLSPPSIQLLQILRQPSGPDDAPETIPSIVAFSSTAAIPAAAAHNAIMRSPRCSPIPPHVPPQPCNPRVPSLTPPPAPRDMPHTHVVRRL